MLGLRLLHCGKRTSNTYTAEREIHATHTESDRLLGLEMNGWMNEAKDVTHREKQTDIHSNIVNSRWSENLFDSGTFRVP